MKLLRFFPELQALVGVPQDPQWHPEGDVWQHTLMVVDEAAKLRAELNDTKDQMAYMLGALCHDFGKPATTVFKDERRRLRRLLLQRDDEVVDEALGLVLDLL